MKSASGEPTKSSHFSSRWIVRLDVLLDHVGRPRPGLLWPVGSGSKLFKERVQCSWLATPDGAQGECAALESAGVIPIEHLLQACRLSSGAVCSLLRVDPIRPDLPAEHLSDDRRHVIAVVVALGTKFQCPRQQPVFSERYR